MALVETAASRALRAGPWGLYVSPPSPLLPVPWAAWIHDQAPAWGNEFLRIVRQARAVGAMDGAPASLNNATLFLGEATRALGQLARAIDTPVPILWPYAVRVYKADTGPAPWPALWCDIAGMRDERSVVRNDICAGVWRAETMRLVTRDDAHVRDAAYTELQLTWRYWLGENGTAAVRGIAPPPPPSRGVALPHDPYARQTLDVDRSAWSCTAPGLSGPWGCISWQLYWPGATEAARENHLSASPPLLWHWQLIDGVAADLEALGSVTELVERCRQFCVMKNLATCKAAGLEVPGELVGLIARIDAQRWTPDRDLSDVTDMVRAVGTLATAANPVVGAVIQAAAGVIDILNNALPHAVGEFRDNWGRREPIVENPFLTGIIQGEYRVAPTHDVATAPVWPSALLPMRRAGPVVIRGAGERAEEVAQGDRPEEPLQSSSRRTAPVWMPEPEVLEEPAGGGEGGGLVVPGGLVFAVGKLLGWW